MTDKEVPLIYYDPKGGRHILGVCELEGNKLTGTITDPHWVELINGLHAGAFSIVPEEYKPADTSLPRLTGEPICRCGHPLDDHSQLSGACWPPGSSSDKTKRCTCIRYEVPVDAVSEAEVSERMQILCPRCARILKEFEPTESERGLFDDDELQRGKSFHWKPCELCEARLAESHRRRH